MRIQKLRIKNGYKRFHDLTIDLGDNPARIVALVGPNGCGKSSVLDGLLFVQNSYDQIGSKGRRDGAFHSLEGVQDFNHTNIGIRFTDGAYADIYQQKAAVQKQKTIFSFRSPYRYNSNLKVNETKAVADLRNNSYGASTSADIDDKMEENYRRLNIKYNTYLHEQNCRPSEAKEHIIGELNASIKNCLDLEVHNLGNIEAGKGSIYFRKADHPRIFDFNVLSSGEKEVVDILLDLYLRKEDFDDSIFLIDEPELHINTSIQRKLLIEINNLVGSNCQLWVATHSIGFLRALQDQLRDDCQVIEFKPGTKWASESVVLSPIEPTRENWSLIFATALDDLTTLIAPSRLVY